MADDGELEMYARQINGLADRHFVQAEQAERRAHECPRCKAIADAIPTEVQLRSILVDDFDYENECFIPREQTAKQSAAGAAFAYGLTLFIDAYGLELAGARISSSLNVLRLLAKTARIEGRRLAAREALADARYLAGEVGSAEAADFVTYGFTPDYPGKARDDAWLKEQEALG